VPLQDVIFTVRLLERPESGGFVERKCPVYRCLACGRTFDENDGEEGAEYEEDGGPSFD